MSLAPISSLRAWPSHFLLFLSQVTKLDYTNLRWGDAEAEAVAAVLSSGAATSLRSLDLGANAISDKGAAATLSPS